MNQNAASITNRKADNGNEIPDIITVDQLN